jgi:RimJ/RimL family protein N-acetyltransferase
MQLAFEILENRFVRLEPLADAHRGDLRAAADADPELWPTLYAYSMGGEHFDAFWERATRHRDQGVWLPFAVVEEGRCVGVSGYTPDAPNKAVEIGGTYYRPEARGGPVNPAAKRLLLENAFACGANRVMFRINAINARSRAAVAKLGAQLEGVLRRDRIVWTGRVRDTSIYSILADEWPEVRAHLDARLAAFA